MVVFTYLSEFPKEHTVPQATFDNVQAAVLKEYTEQSPDNPTCRKPCTSTVRSSAQQPFARLVD